MSMTKKEQRLRRSRQTRQRIANQRIVRLAVHRSNQHIYAAIVSDDGTNTIISVANGRLLPAFSIVMTPPVRSPRPANWNLLPASWWPVLWVTVLSTPGNGM